MASSAMYTAVSGLNALETQLSVISNNLTNQNTYGFKESRTLFGDVLTQSLEGQQAGGGVAVMGVTPSFAQGTLDTTGNTLDMAIDGNGFFTLSGTGGQYYTRNGQFTTDKDGNIVDQKGNYLQGYQVDANGNISDTLGNLNLTTSQVPAKLTANVSMDVNLNAGGAIQGSAFSITNNVPSNYNYSTSVNVYDSQGGSHPVTAYFCKTAANSWDVYYAHTDSSGNLVEDNPVVNGVAVPTVLTFDDTGALSNATGTSIGFDFGAGVTSPQTIAFNYGATGSASTQYNADFAVLSATEDGYSTGTLSKYTIDKTGVINATFTNGQNKVAGQIALTKFPAPDSLDTVDGNLFQQTDASGLAVIGKPGTAGLGNVLSGSLEESNVSQSDQFVKMIAAQSAYEADSKMVTTEEQLLQTLVNMKQ
ncbi:MAG: flagellar basal-body rod protein FlgF [Nitrospiraceae bacterium]|nr:flagellar basal-body rod protein FlgF [Nitrospiraceae bacterium]